MSACVYVFMTLAAWFYGANMTAKLTIGQSQLLVAGGIFYVIGAASYAAHWPNLSPGVFGYHELFHTFVMAASACHFACITNLLQTDFTRGLHD